jgi:hypothetical protein
MLIKEDSFLNKGLGSKGKSPHSKAGKVTELSFPILDRMSIHRIPIGPDRIEANSIGFWEFGIGFFDRINVAGSKHTIIINKEARITIGVPDKQVPGHRNALSARHHDLNGMPIKLKGLFGILTILIKKDGIAINSAKRPLVPLPVLMFYQHKELKL